MVCKGRGRRATSVCANCRLWSDEGVAEAFRRNDAIIVLHKLQLFLFNGASRANCRAQRPRRPALAEGNMSPMMRFLLGACNLFGFVPACGRIIRPYGLPQIHNNCRGDSRIARAGLRKFTVLCARLFFERFVNRPYIDRKFTVNYTTPPNRTIT